MIAFCYQVGDGDIDHKYWQSPEIDAMARPAYFATAELPTTDDVSEAAACLAINYYNFKDTDAKYAAKCLDTAKALFAFAAANEKKVGDGGDGPKSYYTSSKWQDDFFSWMAQAYPALSRGIPSYITHRKHIPPYQFRTGR